MDSGIQKGDTTTPPPLHLPKSSQQSLEQSRDWGSEHWSWWPFSANVFPLPPPKNWHSFPAPAGVSILPSVLHAKRQRCQISAKVWRETCSVWGGRLSRNGAPPQHASLYMVLLAFLDCAWVMWGDKGSHSSELLNEESVCPSNWARQRRRFKRWGGSKESYGPNRFFFSSSSPASSWLCFFSQCTAQSCYKLQSNFSLPNANENVRTLLKSFLKTRKLLRHFPPSIVSTLFFLLLWLT